MRKPRPGDPPIVGKRFPRNGVHAWPVESYASLQQMISWFRSGNDADLVCICEEPGPPHLDPSAFIGAHREVPSHFGLQRLPAAVIAARSTLQGPASIDQHGRTAPIRSHTKTI